MIVSMMLPLAHWPWKQWVGATQAFPQDPQFLSSWRVSVQAVPQTVFPTGHSQTPLSQDCEARQAFPQEPQLFLSVVVFEHTPLQRVVPTGQVHCPVWQN